MVMFHVKHFGFLVIKIHYLNLFKIPNNSYFVEL